MRCLVVVIVVVTHILCFLLLEQIDIDGLQAAAMMAAMQAEVNLTEGSDEDENGLPSLRQVEASTSKVVAAALGKSLSPSCAEISLRILFSPFR